MLYIRTFPMEPLAVNSHLVWIKDGRAVVVDCGGEPDKVLREIANRRLTVTAVLLTHLHADHVLGAARLAQATGAPILGPAADAFLLGPGTAGLEFTDLPPGRHLFLDEPCLVLPVPGHTPGHLVYFFPRSLTAFTGDCLFAGSVGRTDGPGGEAGLLLASIRERLFSLPDAVELFPGHGPSTTVGREKASNPFFSTGPYS
jgi:hydroxyacylglutathione hydrolase